MSVFVCKKIVFNVGEFFFSFWMRIAIKKVKHFFRLICASRNCTSFIYMERLNISVWIELFVARQQSYSLLPSVGIINNNFYLFFVFCFFLFFNSWRLHNVEVTPFAKFIACIIFVDNINYRNNNITNYFVVTNSKKKS